MTWPRVEVTRGSGVNVAGGPQLGLWQQIMCSPDMASEQP